jgi:hypothetical protein
MAKMKKTLLIPEDEACVALVPVETVRKVSALFAKN